jgi:HEPN domain-containing protein
MKGAEREARRWILQAEDDLQFVEWVLKQGVFFDKGCFVSQQAGEKALKSCLYAIGERRVLGHSLFEMIIELIQRDRIFEEIQNQAKRLDRFYITTRYPNGLPGGSPFQIYTKADLSGAYDDLKKIFKISRNFLKTLGID